VSTVRVGKAGFVTSEQKGVTITVGSATTLRVVLWVGSVESVVDVRAVAPMVDSARTAEVSLVNRTEINHLPINGRRADQFALVVPCVTRDGTFGQISYRGFQLSSTISLLRATTTTKPTTPKRVVARVSPAPSV
jgi:hypothetical protein